MKKALFRTLSAALVVIVLGMGVIPALAQTSHTLTLTEDEINDSYRVTNTPRRSVTSAQVDLQDGQAVITASLRLRGHSAVTVSATYIPTVSNGRVTWSVAAATVNGQAASADLLTQINDSISTAWRNYIKNNAEVGRVTAVTITDTDITVTYTAR